MKYCIIAEEDREDLSFFCCITLLFPKLAGTGVDAVADFKNKVTNYIVQNGDEF